MIVYFVAQKKTVLSESDSCSCHAKE